MSYYVRVYESLPRDVLQLFLIADFKLSENVTLLTPLSLLTPPDGSSRIVPLTQTSHCYTYLQPDAPVMVSFYSEMRCF